MKRVLLVAYFFPPQGLSGVQRALRFARYLPRFGWEPVVLAARGPVYVARDETGLERLPPGLEVARPLGLEYGLFVRSGKGGGAGFVGGRGLRRAGAWAQNLFAFPDSRFLWTVTALPAARRLMMGCDAVVATAPPWTDFLVGALAAGGRPFVMDYRDPWGEDPFRYYPTPLHRALARRLERRLVRRADGVLTINGQMAASLKRRFPAEAGKIRVLSQGFDPADFPEAPVPKGETMRIAYTGSFVARRKPDAMLRALAILLERVPEAKVRLTTMGASQWDVSAAARREGVGGPVDILPYSSHADAVRLMQKSHLLWLLVGRGRGEAFMSTAKLYDYIGAGRPILATVPEGAAAEVVRQSGGLVCSPDDPAAIADALTEAWEGFRAGKLRPPSPAFRAKYDGRALTGELAGLLSSLVG